jgi:hypothetical protein
MGVDADGWFIYGWTGLLLGPFVQLQQKGCECKRQANKVARKYE